ncbi:uncharacterized protein [Haliotis asinina]|uniref:uncharacterized protein n=1 Tax=Haliotis asinina TaxID=109174 RepID=UPI00353278AA
MLHKLPEFSTTLSTAGSVVTKGMSKDRTRQINTSQPPSDGESSDTGTVSGSEAASLSHNQSSQELLAILRSRVSDSEAFEELISRLGNLEDNFKNLQQAILNPLTTDSGFSTEPVSDLRSFLSDMEEKIGVLSREPSNVTHVTDPASEGESKGKRSHLKRGHDIREIPEEGTVDRQLSSLYDSTDDESGTDHLNTASVELRSTNEKLTQLRCALDEQIGEVMNKVHNLDHDLKRMAKGVEFALMKSRVSGLSDMVSITKHQECLFPVGVFNFFFI